MMSRKTPSILMPRTVIAPMGGITKTKSKNSTIPRIRPMSFVLVNPQSPFLIDACAWLVSVGCVLTTLHLPSGEAAFASIL